MRIFPFLFLLLVWGGCSPTPPTPAKDFTVSFIGKGEATDGLSLLRRGDTITLHGKGDYLTETKDDFTFAWTAIQGNWNWDVLIDSVSPEALAGIMIRTSKERGASNFFAGTPGAGVLIVQTRLDSGGFTYHPLPMRMPLHPLHFHIEKRIDEPGILEVRDASGYLMEFFFPDFVADSLLVGIALKGPLNSFVSFSQPQVAALPPPPILPQKDSAVGIAHPEIRIVSHKGATYTVPENSLLSRDAAIQCHAEIIELDVRLSSDGIPVILHDDFLGRSTNGTGEVGDRTWADLQKLRLRNPDGSVSTSRIPSLMEYLGNSQHRGLWLLDKAWPIRDSLVPVLQKAGLLHRCIFKGNGTARDARAFLAGFPKAERPAYLHLVRDSPNDALLDSLLAMEILGFDLQTHDEKNKMLTPAFTNRLKTSGKVIMMSPFASQFAAGHSELWFPEPCWEWLLAAGVTWIQTDLPCELNAWRDGVTPPAIH